MKNLLYINIVVFTALLLFFGSCKLNQKNVGKSESVKSRPNIVFIMADDHCVNGVSAYGNALMATPQIDRIAKEGMRFNQMVVAFSLCSPSRANLLTSKYAAENGIRSNGGPFPLGTVTFPELLKEAGYDMCIVGKWHLDPSKPVGFDDYAVIPGHGEYFNSPFNMFGYFSERYTEAPKGYLTNVITDLSIDWIKHHQASGSDKPFCIMVHHKAPHGPDIHEEKHKKMFANQKMPEPLTLYDDWSTRVPLRTGRNTESKLINCNWGQDIYRELMRTAPKEKKARTSTVYQ